jgi:hypothetical protein
MFMDLGGTISGVVYDSGLVAGIRADIQAAVAGQGRPLAGAFVFIEEFPQYSATTDGNGEFRFDHIPTDYPCHVIVRHQSRVDGKWFRERSEPFALSPAKRAVTVTLGVRAADQSLVFVAYDTNGVPIPFARVTIWGETYTTDSLGRVTISLPAGKAEVKIAHSSYSEVKQVVDFGAQSQNELEIALQTSGTANRSPVVGIFSHASPQVPTGGMLRFVANAFDADGDRIFYEWSASSGTISGATDTSVIEWIAPAYATTASITVTAFDSGGGWGRAVMNAMVGGSGGNNHPVIAIVATSTSVFFNEGLTFTASGTDPDGDAITWTWSASHGSLSASDGASVNWISPAATVAATITLTGADGKSGRATTDTTIQVTRLNYAPTIQLIAAATDVLAASGVTVLAAAADRNGDSLVYSWTANKGTITGVGSSAAWSSPAEVTAAVVSCEVNDGYGGTAMASISYNVYNHFPLLTLTATSASALPGESLVLTASVYEGDGDPVTYAWSATKGTLSATDQSSVTWQAPNEVTAATVTCTVADGRGGSDVKSLLYLVNSNLPPTLTLSASEYTAIHGVRVSAVCTAADPNNDILSYSWTSDSGSFLYANAPDVTWTAGAGPVTAKLECIVSDGRGGVASAAMNISVLDGRTLAVGESYTWDVNGNTTLRLGTPDQKEKFGLVFYPLNTASATYSFRVNGGGDVLPSLPASSLLPGLSGRFHGQPQADTIFRSFEQKLRGRLLRSVQFSPIDPPSAAEAVNVGDTQVFKVVKINADGSYTFLDRTYQLKKIGTKCKLFVDTETYSDDDGTPLDPADITDAALEEMKTEFDNKIYDYIHTNYGRTWDKDGDGKVAVMFSPVVNNGGMAGYFYSLDLTDNANSNQRDCFHMMVYRPSHYTVSGISGWTKDVKETLVHEFQHLVNYCEHSHYNGGSGEESWLNEGLSMEAEWRYSGERPEFVSHYASATEQVSITNWNQDRANYGGDALFLRYIYEQLGTDTIKTMVSTNLTDTDNIDSACSGRSGFKGMFKDWALTLFRYNKGLPVSSRYDFQFPVNISLSAKTAAKKYSDAYTGNQTSTSLRFVIIDPPAGYAAKYSEITVTDVNNGQYAVSVVRLKDS